MPPPVYTVQFAAVNLTTAGAHALYTVPSGKVAVVTDCSITSYLAASQGGLRLLAAASTYLLFTPAMAALAYLQWAGKGVATAGQGFDFVMVAGTLDVSIAGYLFDA